jgi:predicted HAD superfamily phosphohydrolase YqeG
MNDNIDKILDELIVPWDTSDLPPNVRITSPSLKIAQAKAAIQAEIRAARIDELQRITNAKGLHAATSYYVTKRYKALTALQGDSKNPS